MQNGTKLAVRSIRPGRSEIQLKDPLQSVGMNMMEGRARRLESQVGFANTRTVPEMVQLIHDFVQVFGYSVPGLAELRLSLVDDYV